MDSLIKMKRLAGIPVDLSKTANAQTTVRAPRALTEAAKVPQHRGELAPKTKDNMRARVNHAKKALEALEMARDELMDLPAVDYMTDIPDLIKQLHQILHGDDGTGGVHHLHRHYKHEFDNTVFPEDVEEEKRKSEEEAQQQEAGITGDEPEAKKKKTNEGFDAAAMRKKASNPAPSEAGKSDSLGLAPDSLATDSSMVADKAQAKTVGEDPKDNTPLDDKVLEADESDEESDIKPEVKKVAKDVAKKELAKNPFEQEEETEEDCEMSTPVAEASGPLFARDAQHPKHGSEPGYSSWGDSKKPVNAVSAEDGPSLYYPDGAKRENANQLSMNPYNESQKVNVPAKIKSALKEEADKARKLAETFTMRKDWDSKNFHETLANAMDTLNQFLDKGTVYGIKEAQVFMTSLMSPFTNKLPAEVIKFVAAGGSLRSLKSYVNDVKAPHTGTVFQQDSNGLTEAKNHLGEKQYTSYSSWKAACKAAGATSFEGNSEICQAKPGIGEWDGETGSVYKK
jgi:hypothetical protein